MMGRPCTYAKRQKEKGGAFIQIDLRSENKSTPVRVRSQYPSLGKFMGKLL